MSNIRIKRIKLYDLAVWYDYVLCGYCEYFQKAKGFRLPNSNISYWYITNVRQDDTYPCHPFDEKHPVYYPNYIAGETEVEIIY